MSRWAIFVIFLVKYELLFAVLFSSLNKKYQVVVEIQIFHIVNWWHNKTMLRK